VAFCRRRCKKETFLFCPVRNGWIFTFFDRQYAMMTKMIISLKEEVVDEVV